MHEEFEQNWKVASVTVTDNEQGMGGLYTKFRAARYALRAGISN